MKYFLIFTLIVTSHQKEKERERARERERERERERLQLSSSILSYHFGFLSQTSFSIRHLPKLAMNDAYKYVYTMSVSLRPSLPPSLSPSHALITLGGRGRYVGEGACAVAAVTKSF